MTIERHDHRLQIQCAHQHARDLDVRLGRVRLQPRRLLGLGPVGRDARRAAVLRVIRDRGRIDQNRLARRPRPADHFLTKRLRADALVVILDAHHIRIRQRRVESRKEHSHRLFVQRPARLVIHTEHLLRVPVLRQTDQRALDRCRARAIGHKPAAPDALTLERLAQPPTLVVIAGDTKHRNLAAHGDEIQADVGRSARAMLGAFDVQHGRIVAEPVRVAVEKLVEHQIAHHERPEVSEP